MAWGWQIYEPNGRLLTDHTRFNCYFLDVFQSNPGSRSGNYDRYSKSFPEYAHSEIRVISGGGPLVTAGGNVSGASKISINVTYSWSGVPTVTIKETRGNSTGSGSTFWITVSRLDSRSSIADTYGIALYDRRGGLAFPPRARPYVFTGKAEKLGGFSGGEPTNTSYLEAGYLAYETNSPDPPLCFWRTSGGSYLPHYGAVKRSRNAPSRKRYRWALGVSPTGFGVLPESNSGMEAYCFEAVNTTPSSSHGILLKDGAKSFSLGDDRALTIVRQAMNLGDFTLSGNDVLISTPANKSAMLPLYSFIRYNGGGIYDQNQVRWSTPYASPLRGNHRRNQSSSNYGASWYRSLIASEDMATYVIDCSQYD